MACLSGHSGVLCHPLILWREKDGVRVWEIHAVQPVGNAWGEGVAAWLGILLRECGVVLQGAGVCAFVQ